MESHHSSPLVTESESPDPARELEEHPGQRTPEHHLLTLRTPGLLPRKGLLHDQLYQILGKAPLQGIKPP